MVVEWVAGGAALGLLFTKGRARLELSRAKHRSLAGHARWSRRVAGLVPFYAYDDDRFFRCDGAPDAVEARRRAGFMRLTQLYSERFPRTAEMAGQARESVSDLRFTSS
jgi:glutamate-1-semialdehyde 2,1-aminomutase